MAISEQQRQKKLLKKKQKKAAVVKTAKAFTSVSAASCVNYPIYECCIPNNMFEIGMGELFVARRLPNGNLAVSCFLIDVFCLGVKDAFFRTMDDDGYNHLKAKTSSSGNRYFERIHPSSAKKLLEGAVDYAKNLGFAPHPDYKKAVVLLSTIDSSASSEHFEYGKGGKPLYMRGSKESQSKAQQIIGKLHAKCGEGNYHFVMGLSDGLMFEDEETDYDLEDDDDLENEFVEGEVVEEEATQKGIGSRLLNLFR